MCRQLGHIAREWPEVVHHRLVDQHITIGQKQDALLLARFPKAPDDLKGRVGFTGSEAYCLNRFRLGQCLLLKLPTFQLGKSN